MLDYEFKNFIDYKFIVGVDEVGRGCCVGLLVVVFVIMFKNYNNERINDLKKFSVK